MGMAVIMQMCCKPVSMSIAKFLIMRQIRCIVLGVLLMLSGVAQATSHHTGNWDTAFIMGPLSADKKIQYYLQPQIDFIDTRYKFQSAFMFIGLGYATTPTTIAWLMDAPSVIKTLSGETLHINTIRQQLDWRPQLGPRFSFVSNTRLEERKNLADPQWAFRLREKALVRYLLPHWPTHSLVTFDEIFLSLNHPAWTNSNSFFGQNRLFLGIGTQVSAVTEIDAGYLNQYLLYNNGNQLNNVLYVAFNITFE